MAQPALHLLISFPGGEVARTSENQQTVFASLHYAPARRAGDHVHISGVVIARKPVAPNTPATFKGQAKIAFERIRTFLIGGAQAWSRRRTREALQVTKHES